MRNIILSAVSVMLLAFTAAAQPYRSDFAEASRLMEEGFYNKALTVWHKIDSDYPDIPNIQYKIGYCYLNSNLDRGQALPYLELAATDISRNYDPYNPGEKKAPKEVAIYLAEAYHLNYKLDEAIATYNAYLEENPKDFRADELRRQITICETAKVMVADSIPVGIRNMGAVLNSDEGDFSPVISVDEGALFFTSRRLRSDSLNQYVFDDIEGKHYEDIYASYRDENGEWTEPTLLGFSSVDNHEATINVSADGQTLFIYQAAEGNGDLFTSTQIGDVWTNPEPLGSDINSKYWETHVTMSADGNTLFFVSDRKGGMGGRDIYRCVKLPNGEWSKALNVGAPINTPYDEDAPFLHPDGKTMYFASRGHATMGGFDIFKTEMSAEGKWSDPINIGYPINTVDDDVFYVTSADGSRAYYTSQRAGGFGEKDLYVLEMSNEDEICLAVVKGRIFTDGRPIPESLVIYLTDVATGQNTSYRPRARDGVFVAVVEPGYEYIIEYTINDSTVYDDQFLVPTQSCYVEIEFPLELKPIVMNGDTLLSLDSIPTDPTDASGEIAKTFKWQLRYKDLPYDKQGVVVTYLGDDGQIKFTEAVGSQGTFAYHEIPGVTEYIFGIESGDGDQCEDMEIVLLDENDKPIGGSKYLGDCEVVWRAEGWANVDGEITVVPADYQRFYKYNKFGVDEEKKWKAFLDKVVQIIEVKGTVDVTVEGSASKVPTRTFGTNENLSQTRSAAPKKMLLKGLAERGYDESVVRFVAVNSLVQGPAYETGNIRPVAEYERYQYIKISAIPPE